MIDVIFLPLSYIVDVPKGMSLEEFAVSSLQFLVYVKVAWRLRPVYGNIQNIMTLFGSLQSVCKAWCSSGCQQGFLQVWHFAITLQGLTACRKVMLSKLLEFLILHGAHSALKNNGGTLLVLCPVHSMLHPSCCSHLFAP